MICLERVLEVDFDPWDYLHHAVKGSEGMEEDFFSLLSSLGVHSDDLEYIAEDDEEYIDKLKERYADEIREAIIENEEEEKEQEDFLRDMESYWRSTRL